MADTSVIHSYHISMPFLFAPANNWEIAVAASLLSPELSESLDRQRHTHESSFLPVLKEFEFIFLECCAAIASEMPEWRSLFQHFPLIGRTQSPTKVCPQHSIRPISCQCVNYGCGWCILCPSAGQESSNKPSWTCGLSRATPGRERWKTTFLFVLRISCISGSWKLFRLASRGYVPNLDIS